MRIMTSDATHHGNGSGPKGFGKVVDLGAELKQPGDLEGLVCWRRLESMNELAQ